MRIIYLLLIYCLTPLAGLAQQPICSSTIKTKYNTLEVKSANFNDINPYSIGYAKTGGYWVGGLVRKSTGDVDFFLSKFNDTGKCLVATAIGSSTSETGYPIPVFPTSDGGCLVAGRNNSSYELASISKLDKNGTLVWSRQSPSQRIGVYDAFRGIHVDNNNKILAVGTGMQLTGKANLIAALIDSNGNEIWLRNFDFGGAQHHFNAIAKTDSIYTVVGWCTFGGSISPIMAQISETGRFVRSNYYPANNTTTFSDVLISPSKIIYTLGYSNTSSGQHCYLTSLKMDGTVLWQKAIGYGGDVGNKLLMDDGQLWVSGKSSNLGAANREYYLRLDTAGNVLQYGGLFWDSYSFSSKHQGWSINRSHTGGLVAVGVDNRLSIPHFNIIFGNPCQTENCGVNKINAPNIQSMSLTRQVLSCTVNDNGDLTKENLNEQSLPLGLSINCNQNCTFDSRKVLPAALTICNGGSDILTTDVRNADYKYLWSNGDTAAKHAFFKPGMYWVKTYNECGSRFDTVLVTGIDAPIYNKLVDTLYCDKQWLRRVDMKSLAETTITWENGDVLWSRSFTSPGKYWFEIKNRCGVWRDSFVITQDSAPKSVLPSDLNPCSGKYILLDGTQLGKGQYQYLWEDGYKGPSLWVTSNATKILKTWNRCGSITDTVNIVFGECNCHFYVPNAFTPRASRGKNDVWKPVFNCNANAYFSIYSRWGECLVRNQPIDVPWDGYYMGDLVPEGIYVYIIHGNYTDAVKGGQRLEKSGTVLVIDGGK